MSQKNTPEAMKYEYYVRWFNKEAGEWQAVNVQKLTEEEFRQFICWKIGLVGVRKDAYVDLSNDV